MDNTLKFLLENQKELLSFLKSRFHLYHLSNVFFRDIHYGVMAYLEWKGMRSQYSQTENIAQGLVDSYVKAGILKNVDRNAYVLNYPEFKKPPVKPAAPAKPAAGTAATKPAAVSAATATAPAGKPAPAAPQTGERHGSQG